MTNYSWSPPLTIVVGVAIPFALELEAVQFLSLKLNFNLSVVCSSVATLN